MTDLQKAQNALPGHTLALCRGEEILMDDRRGVVPMLSFLSEGRDLSGFCAAAERIFTISSPPMPAIIASSTCSAMREKPSQTTLFTRPAAM